MKTFLSPREQLQALVDGQLPAEQAQRLLAELEQDPALQQELYELQHLKLLIQSAYPLPESKPFGMQRTRWAHTWPQAAVAALVLVALSTVFGAGGYYYAHAQQEPAGLEGVTLAATAKYDNRFIVFLDSHEPERLARALSKAEQLAEQVQPSGGSVYVVTSAEGVDLLRLGTTPYEARIVRLRAHYPQLRFVACSNTLYSFKQRGELVELVETAEVAPSAVEFVVQHLRQGWRYIAI